MEDSAGKCRALSLPSILHPPSSPLPFSPLLSPRERLIGHLEHPDDAIFAAGGDALSVGGDGNADDGAVVAGEGGELLSRREVDQTDLAAIVRDGEPSAVGAQFQG